jgi:hypothetical protein
LAHLAVRRTHCRFPWWGIGAFKQARWIDAATIDNHRTSAGVAQPGEAVVAQHA